MPGEMLHVSVMVQVKMKGVLAGKGVTPVRVVIALWVVLSLILTLGGPFGTYSYMPLPTRLALWALLAGMTLVVARILRRELDRCLRGWSFGARAVTVALAVAIVVSPVIHLIINLAATRGMAHFVPLSDTLGIGFLGALAFALVQVLLRWVPAMGGAEADQDAPDAAVALHADTPDAPVADDPAPRLPRLADRLPQEVRGRIVSISVRDHYVDVHTEMGNASLLMRLSDAIGEVEDVDGAQVHRSHWVAWSFVAGVEKARGSLFLILDCGRRIPVSRANREKLVARGLI